MAEWLRSEGHNVVETRSVATDPGDNAILEWALREERILITTDTDFGKLIFVDHRPHCGMVRLPQVPHAARLTLISEVLARHAEELEQGAIITVKGRRIRLTWPERNV